MQGQLHMLLYTTLYKGLDIRRLGYLREVPEPAPVGTKGPHLSSVGATSYTWTFDCAGRLSPDLCGV